MPITPGKTNWTTIDGVTSTDINRIESNIQTLDSEKAPLASPIFTGAPAVGSNVMVHQGNIGTYAPAPATHDGNLVTGNGMITRNDYDRLQHAYWESNLNAFTGSQGSFSHSELLTLPFNKEAYSIYLPTWVNTIMITFTSKIDKNKAFTVYIGRSSSYFNAWGYHSINGRGTFANINGFVSSTASLGAFVGFGAGVLDDQGFAVVMSLAIINESNNKKLHWYIANIGGSASQTTNIGYDAVWICT